MDTMVKSDRMASVCGPAIGVTARCVYGQTLYYPADAMGLLVCDLAGTKTMTGHLIQTIKRHGGRVVVVAGDDVGTDL